MKAAGDPVGPKNDERIGYYAASAALVIAGWGPDGAFRHRNAEVTMFLLPTRHQSTLLETHQGRVPAAPAVFERRFAAAIVRRASECLG